MYISSVCTLTSKSKYLYRIPGTSPPPCFGNLTLAAGAAKKAIQIGFVVVGKKQRGTLHLHTASQPFL